MSKPYPFSIPGSPAPPGIYRQCAPTPELAPLVLCHWTMANLEPREKLVRVLPDGCTDVILDPDGALASGRNAFSGRGAAFVAGITDRAGLVRLRPGGVVAGVRFRPEGAAAFLGVSARELADGHVGLPDILPGTDLLLMEAAQSMRRALLDHGTPASGDWFRPWACLLDRLLLERVGRQAEADRLAARAVAYMARELGQADISGVAGVLNVSIRSLERCFARHVGLSPKRFSRVLRLREAVLGLRGPFGRPERPWSDLALSSGYADQAHLVREFRSMTGVTPTTLAAEHGDVAFIQYDLPGLG